MRAISLVCVWAASWPVLARADFDFDTQVAPLLARRCLSCHNGTDRKGGLDLTAEVKARAGGDSGRSFVPGRPDESLLWQRVVDDEMPPKTALPREEKQVLREWLAAGAKWGATPIDPLRFTSESRAGYDWWCLQPVRKPKLPRVTDESWPAGDLDRFILASLERVGLRPAPAADRRTLIRRLSFDLVGLPPSPEEVDAFVADERPEAYAKLVDRLLDSPHYGERWARHWLDIVRFGESQGFEWDKLRSNAWPYRDWVISAFNNDLPYDEFVRLQLAGDVLLPHDPRGAIAAGFLTVGPWDEPGQTQQGAAMKAVVRQDELEDVIGVTSQTFLGLTVNCARCHDHKFDPVSQRDYYRLAAVFAGTRHGERPVQSELGRVQLAGRIARLREQVAALEARLETFDFPVRQKILAERGRTETRPIKRPKAYARWEFDGDLRDQVGGLHGKPHGEARVEGGRLILPGNGSFVETAPLGKTLVEKTLEVWVELADVAQRGGGAMTVESSSGAVFDGFVYGAHEAGCWSLDSHSAARRQTLPADTGAGPARTPVQLVATYDADGTIAAYRNGRPCGKSTFVASLTEFSAGTSRVVFGLAHSPPEPERHLAGSIERAALYDRALAPDEVALLAGTSSDHVATDELLATLTPADRTERNRLVLELSRAQLDLRLLSCETAYTVSPLAPEKTRLLERGNPATPADELTPGALVAVGGLAFDFELPVDAPEAHRRLRLAEWVTDSRNPLTPRVIVNRLWHYHFGLGLIETPNDFGFNGSRPSHPELLDYLASELIQRRWSLKQLHKLIVTSATYRQSSQANAAAERRDAQNRLLWRHSPHRLEAEALRDALLTVAGELNPAMGGPGYQDFRTYFRGSQLYDMLDRAGQRFHRRTLYRTWVRSGRSEMLDVFDCPDPSIVSPRRAVTTTPLQALSLLNGPFAMRMADRFADRVRQTESADPAAQCAQAYRLALGRLPYSDESNAARALVEIHGLAALCRVLFNSNEFLYVD